MEMDCRRHIAASGEGLYAFMTSRSNVNKLGGWGHRQDWAEGIEYQREDDKMGKKAKRADGGFWRK
jgi:hypothetical protein